MTLDFDAYLVPACSSHCSEEKCLAQASILGPGAWSFVPYSLKKTFYHWRSQIQMPIGTEHITQMTKGQQIWTLGNCIEHVLRGQPLSAAVSGGLWEGALHKVNRGRSKAGFSWEI